MATQRRRAGQANAQKALFGGKKVQNTGNAKVDAKRQTLNDRQAYKRDRANGERDLRSDALDRNGKFGGPSFPESQRGSRTYRKTVDVPDKVITQKTPNLAQSEKASAKKNPPPAVKDRQKELDDLKKMEGIDELKKKKSSKA